MKTLLAFPLIRLALIVLVGSLLSVALFAIPRPSAVDSAWWTVGIQWIMALLLLAVLFLVERLTTGQLPKAIGFDPRRAVRDLAAGVVLGAILFSAVVLELWLGGYYHVVSVHATPDLAVAALLFVAVALTEELLFRGVVFRLVEEWAGTWIALAVSAILFGGLHVANPGATWVSTVAIALEAGILLAATYVVTKNLWLPIALHFSWNFFEGPIYGAQVSGHTFLQSAFGAQIAGPAWITGGSFGPEAGLPAIVTCGVVAVTLLAYAKRAGLIEPPRWLRARSHLRATS